MKFFQVLITNRFTNKLNRQYTDVYNYASLAEALETMSMYEDKNQSDGCSYTDNFGDEVSQFHLHYKENGGAVIELRHEYFGCRGVHQVTSQRSVYVKEIDL